MEQFSIFIQKKKNYTNMKLNLSHEILIDVVTMKSELYNLALPLAGKKLGGNKQGDGY